MENKKNKKFPDWASCGTNSHLNGLEGYPMVTMLSVADGPNSANSTGDIYFYLVNLDFPGHDVTFDKRMTLFFSQEMSQECSKKGIDPMCPTCVRVTISGTVERVRKV